MHADFDRQEETRVANMKELFPCLCLMLWSRGRSLALDTATESLIRARSRRIPALTDVAQHHLLCAVFCLKTLAYKSM